MEIWLLLKFPAPNVEVFNNLTRRLEPLSAGFRESKVRATCGDVTEKTTLVPTFSGLMSCQQSVHLTEAYCHRSLCRCRHISQGLGSTARSLPPNDVFVCQRASLQRAIHTLLMEGGHRLTPGLPQSPNSSAVAPEEHRARTRFSERDRIILGPGKQTWQKNHLNDKSMKLSSLVACRAATWLLHFMNCLSGFIDAWEYWPPAHACEKVFISGASGGEFTSQLARTDLEGQICFQTH